MSLHGRARRRCAPSLRSRYRVRVGVLASRISQSNAASHGPHQLQSALVLAERIDRIPRAMDALRRRGRVRHSRQGAWGGRSAGG